MKRYIHSQEYIQGMAYERSKGLDILKSNNDTLSIHIIKCVVYGDDTNFRIVSIYILLRGVLFCNPQILSSTGSSVQ